MMYVDFISGINSDEVKVTVVDCGKQVFSEMYNFGYNASYNRQNAEYAHNEVLNAEKFGWSPRREKPFIGDILKDIVETYNVGNNEIKYSGKNTFKGTNMSDAEVQNIVDKILEEV